MSSDEETTLLEQLFVDFAGAVLQQITIWVKSEAILVILHQQTVFQSTNSWTPRFVVQKDYWHWLDRHISQLLSLEVAQQCAYAHWKAGILKLPSVEATDISSVTEFTPAQMQSLVGDLLYPLVDVFQRYDSLEPIREHLLESYRRFHEAWVAVTVRQDSTIPLLNFSAEVESLPARISSSFQLAPFYLEEKTAFWSIVDGFQSWDLFPFYSFLAAGCKLQGSRVHPRMQGAINEQMRTEFFHSHQNMLNELRNIITALRLIKAGDVAVTAYIEQSSEAPPQGGHWAMGIPGAGLSDFQVRRHGLLSPYLLQEAELPIVRSLVEALHRLDALVHRGGLEVALSRFNQSYSRDFFEDRLIDLTIALESCLLAGSGSNTELKYRFTLRGATLLAKEADPQEVFRQLTALYDARSAIVHEGKYLSQQKSQRLLNQDPKSFVQTCEDLTRIILRTYLKKLIQAPKPRKIKDINLDLEQRVLKGLLSAEESGE